MGGWNTYVTELTGWIEVAVGWEVIELVGAEQTEADAVRLAKIAEL